MKPHEARKTERAGAAAVRTHLRVHLGWLRGFPLAGETEPLQWLTVPRLGRHAQHTTLDVTRERLRATEYNRNAARRKFPRALPKVVGDVDAWSARIDAQLRLLKGVVHAGARLPKLEALLEAANFRRATAELAAGLAKRRPAIVPIVSGLVWLHWHDEAELAAALNVIQIHSDTLVIVLTCLDEPAGLVLVQRCIQLLMEGGEPTLIEFLADRRIWEVPLAHGDLPEQLQNTLRRFRKGHELDKRLIVEGFPKPTAKLGSDLVKALERVIPLAKTTRALQLRLLSSLLPRDELDEWEEWWQEMDFFERKTRSLLSKSNGTRLPPELATQARLLEEEINAAREAPRVFRLSDLTQHVEDICTEVPPDVFTNFFSCLQLLIWRHKDIYTREAFIKNWSATFRTFPNRFGVIEQLLKAQHRLLQLTASDPERVAWVCHQVTRRFADEWIEEAKAQSLIEPVTAALHILIPQTETWHTHYGPFADFTGWDTLIVAVEATSDGTRAADLLAAVPPVRAGLHGRQWGILLQLSGLSAPRFQTLAKGWRGDDWSEASLKELTFLAKQPATAQLIADALANGEGKRLSQIIAQSSLNRVLGASDSAEPIGPLPEEEHGTELDLTPYPAELHDLLETLSRSDPNAAQAANTILSEAFPLPARLHEELANLRELVANADGARRTALQTRISNLEARLAAPSHVSPLRLDKFRAKLERRIQYAQLLNWEQIVSARLRERLAAKIGVPYPDDWMQSKENMTVLNALAELPPGFKDLAFRLIRTRCGPEPWDLRDEAPNRAFLDAIARRGINLSPWLEGIGPRQIRTEARMLTLDLEKDPLQIMRMGAPFDTCLAPGSFNFFSAVSNAADINKRILYARDSDGVIHGRCLLALSEDGELITFNVYAHADGGAIQDAVAAYVSDLAGAMGAVLAADGQIRELISTRWYDDGAIDLTGQLAFLRPSSAFVKALATLPAEDLVPQLQHFLGSQNIPPSVLHALANQEAFQQRPELAAPLIPHIRSAVALYDWARLSLADMFRKGGHPDIALEILEPMLRTLSRDDWEVSLAEQLIKLGFPHRALRLIRRTRQPWVKDWSDEWRGRVLVAADALAALRRPKQALELYRIAAKAGAPDASARIAELQRELQRQIV